MEPKQLSDPQTWADQHGDYLYRCALLRVRDPALAEEVVQETFLAALQAAKNFHCYHVLEQPPPGWSMGVGRIIPEMLREQLPAPASGTIVFLCGPPPMADTLERSLKDLGYAEEAVILP